MKTKLVAVLLMTCLGLSGAVWAQELDMDGLTRAGGGSDEVVALRVQVAKLEAQVRDLRKGAAASKSGCGGKEELVASIRERAWAIAFNDVDGGTTGIELVSAVLAAATTHVLGSPTVEVIVTYRCEQWGRYYRMDGQGNYLYDRDGYRQTFEKKTKVTVKKTVKVKLTEQEYATLSK